MATSNGKVAEQSDPYQTVGLKSKRPPKKISSCLISNYAPIPQTGRFMWVHLAGMRLPALQINSELRIPQISFKNSFQEQIKCNDDTFDRLFRKRGMSMVVPDKEQMRRLRDKSEEMRNTKTHDILLMRRSDIERLIGEIRLESQPHAREREREHNIWDDEERIEIANFNFIDFDDDLFEDSDDIRKYSTVGWLYPSRKGMRCISCCACCRKFTPNDFSVHHHKVARDMTYHVGLSSNQWKYTTGLVGDSKYNPQHKMIWESFKDDSAPPVKRRQQQTKQKLQKKMRVELPAATTSSNLVGIDLNALRSALGIDASKSITSTLEKPIDLGKSDLSLTEFGQGLLANVAGPSKKSAFDATKPLNMSYDMSALSAMNTTDLLVSYMNLTNSINLMTQMKSLEYSKPAPLAALPPPPPQPLTPEESLKIQLNDFMAKEKEELKKKGLSPDIGKPAPIAAPPLLQASVLSQYLLQQQQQHNQQTEQLQKLVASQLPLAQGQPVVLPPKPAMPLLPSPVAPFPFNANLSSSSLNGDPGAFPKPLALPGPSNVNMYLPPTAPVPPPVLPPSKVSSVITTPPGLVPFWSVPTYSPANDPLRQNFNAQLATLALPSSSS